MAPDACPIFIHKRLIKPYDGTNNGTEDDIDNGTDDTADDSSNDDTNDGTDDGADNSAFDGNNKMRSRKHESNIKSIKIMAVALNWK